MKTLDDLLAETKNKIKYLQETEINKIGTFHIKQMEKLMDRLYEIEFNIAKRIEKLNYN